MIEARDVRIEVVGTRFAVGVAADGTVGVRGDEGTVQVVHPAGRTLVHGGEVWPSASAAPMIDDAARAAVAFATQLTAMPPTPQPASAPIAHTPTAPGQPTTPHRATPLNAAETAPETAAETETETAAETETETAAPTAAESTPYLLARRLEDAKDLTAALAAYRAIRSGPEAEDALYASARLLLGPIGHPAAAHQSFLEYRRRFPDGRYARAVDWHLFDHAVTHDPTLALREADRFLTDHPDDPLAPRFRESRERLRQRLRP